MNKMTSKKSEMNTAKMALIKSLVKKDLASLATGNAASCGFSWCKP